LPHVYVTGSDFVRRTPRKIQRINLRLGARGRRGGRLAPSLLRLDNRSPAGIGIFNNDFGHGGRTSGETSCQRDQCRRTKPRSLALQLDPDANRAAAGARRADGVRLGAQGTTGGARTSCSCRRRDQSPTLAAGDRRGTPPRIWREEDPRSPRLVSRGPAGTAIWARPRRSSMEAKRVRRTRWRRGSSSSACGLRDYAPRRDLYHTLAPASSSRAEGGCASFRDAAAIGCRWHRRLAPTAGPQTSEASIQGYDLPARSTAPGDLQPEARHAVGGRWKKLGRCTRVLGEETRRKHSILRPEGDRRCPVVSRRLGARGRLTSYRCVDECRGRGARMARQGTLARGRLH